MKRDERGLLLRLPVVLSLIMPTVSIFFGKPVQPGPKQRGAVSLEPIRFAAQISKFDCRHHERKRAPIEAEIKMVLVEEEEERALSNICQILTRCEIKTNPEV